MSDLSQSELHLDSGAIISAIEGFLFNRQTGMGTSLSAFHQTTVGYASLLSEQELRSLYRSNWLIRRVVDIPAQDMTKHEPVVELPDDGDPASVDRVMELYRDADPTDSPFESSFTFDQVKRDALMWARLFGRAYIVLHLNNGEDPAKPLKRVTAFNGATVLDRLQLRAAAGELNYYNPEFYQLNHQWLDNNNRDRSFTSTIGQRIHRSRVLVYDGNRIHPWDVQVEGDGGHDSVIQNLYEIFVRHYQAREGVSEGLASYSLFVATINNLAEILIHPEGKEKLQNYLTTLNQQKSVYRTVVKDGAAGNADFVERTFTGVADNVLALANELTAATGLPHYKIWGSESNTNALSNGGAESRAYAETVASWQKSECEPNDRRFFKMLFSATAGDIPNFEIKYPSIYVPTPQEEAEIEERKAKTFEIYLANGVATPKQVRMAIATNQSLENILDVDEIESESDDVELQENSDDKYGHINFKPSSSVKAAFARAIRALENGDIKPGSGLESATVREARAIARGESVTPAKVRKAHAWFARNQRFKNFPKDKPAWAAWALWGYDTGKGWFNKLYLQMEAADRNDACNECESVNDAEFTDKELHEKATIWAKRTYNIWPSAYASAGVVNHYRKLYKEKHGTIQGAFRDDWLDIGLDGLVHIDDCNANQLRWMARRQDDLNQWFQERWVRISASGEILGECGDRGENEGKPKCLPLSRAQSMSKAERAAAVRRKRESDPNPNRKGGAVNVSTDEIEQVKIEGSTIVLSDLEYDGMSEVGSEDVLKMINGVLD